MEARERLKAEPDSPADAPDIAEKAFPKNDGDRNTYGTCLAALIAMWAAFLACVLGVLRKRDIH